MRTRRDLIRAVVDAHAEVQEWESAPDIVPASEVHAARDRAHRRLDEAVAALVEHEVDR